MTKSGSQKWNFKTEINLTVYNEEKRHFCSTVTLSLSAMYRKIGQSETLSIKLPVAKCIHQKEKSTLDARLGQ